MNTSSLPNAAQETVQGLISLADSMQQIADAVAAAMGVDVTIADYALLRVAGTGPFAAACGERVPGGCAFERALYCAETLIVEDPREASLCAGCQGRDGCAETFGMCTPITVNGGRAGILAIVAFTSEQRNRIRGSLSSYVRFLEKMAELIATKMTEHRLMMALEKRSCELEAVVNHIHQGVVCVDASCRIRQMNARAVELLKLQASVPRAGDSLEKTWPDCLLLKCMKQNRSCANTGETYLAPSGKLVRFLSSASALVHGDEIIGGVVTFSDLESTHSDAFRAIERGTSFTFDDIIGTSDAMAKAKRQALTAAQFDSNILLTGETGTGKELFARAIHSASPRCDFPFVSVNCAAVPESLLESELFGYEPGAFTGASKNGKPGKFELANHGTLFLDEIGDMSLFLQSKLLRAVQNKEITRVGGLYPKRIDARIISATNQDLGERMRTQRFRSDLYYHLNVVPVALPPLRQRPEDVPVLVRHFVAYYSRKFGRAVTGIARDALDLLMAYDWLGNVRELENVVEYAVSFATGNHITAEELRV
ncbi:MAG TPA: Fis family transcriptional regulator, partial [Firmicutes bacterium]|nr:Fis family transcriptional regulator [Bacillota bacterium]